MMNIKATAYHYTTALKKVYYTPTIVVSVGDQVYRLQPANVRFISEREAVDLAEQMVQAIRDE